MRWLRFSIGQVMLAVVYAAIGFSAFRTAGNSLYGKVLDDLFFQMTLVLLTLASLMTFFRDGAQPGASVGFRAPGLAPPVLRLAQCGWPRPGGSLEAQIPPHTLHF